jgi:outer membrane receptor for ferric coprogen and ferric-rhodotorulic acid
VFGTNDNIVDVPRNVTIISRQQLSDISISSVLDFSKLTSSAYTTTNFGAPANPSIRGQTADLFINGVRGRITSNGNGLPLNFNSVESVNIVKGPATAVQGTSMYVGGFVDLITKRPYFDGFKGTVSVTIGSYSRRNGRSTWVGRYRRPPPTASATPARTARVTGKTTTTRTTLSTEP